MPQFLKGVRLPVGFLLPLLVLLLALPALGGTYRIPATADAHVSDLYPTVNDGANYVMMAGRVPGSGLLRAFIKFDVASLPANESVVSATLKVYCSSVSSASCQFCLHQVGASWAEMGITWNNQPACGPCMSPPGDFTFSNGTWKSISVIPTLVKDWRTGVTQNNGMAIWLNPESQQCGADLRSRESSFPETLTVVTEAKGCFHGHVTDCGTGQAIAGAQVDWGIYGTVTDAQGNYSFNFNNRCDLTCGTNNLIIQKNCYQTYNQPYTLLCDGVDHTKDVCLVSNGPTCLPTNCVATQNQCNAITVSWQATLGNCNGYYVYRDGSPIANPTTSPWVDTPITGTHSYYVVGYNACGQTAPSNTAQGNGLTAPPTPTGLQVTAATCSTVVLGWNASVGATEYCIQRDGGPDSCSITSTSWKDSNPGATAHNYKVKAKNACGASVYSSPVPGQATPLATPTGLTVTPGCGTITISWNPVTGATWYCIQRDSDPEKCVGIASWVDTLPGTVQHCYKVRAKADPCYSAYTGQLCGTATAVLTTPTAICTPDCGSITVTWSPVAGATQYCIQRDSETEICSVTSPWTDNNPGTNQRCYKVKAKNGSCTSAYSTPTCCTALTLPGAPTLVSPSNGASNLTLPIILDWNSVLGATKYRVQVDNDSSFTTPEIDTQPTASYYTISSLNPGTYYWRVCAYNGCWGYWSSPAWKFTYETSPVPDSNVIWIDSTTIAQGYSQVMMRNSEDVSAFTIPLIHDSPYPIDSVSRVGCRTENWELFKKTINAAAKTVLIGGIANMGGGTPCMLAGEGCVAKIYWHKNCDIYATVCFDTAFIAPAGAFQVVDCAAHTLPTAFVKSCSKYQTYIFGDVNGNNQVDISDVVYLVNYIFSPGAPPPIPSPCAGDADGDCLIRISDCVRLVMYVFPDSISDTIKPVAYCSHPVEFNKRAVGEVEIGLTNTLSDQGNTLTLFAEAGQQIKGAQLEFATSGNVEIVEVTNNVEGMQEFHGTVDGMFKVGLLDLTGEKTIPAGTNDIVTIKYKGTGEIRLVNAIMVGADAAEMNVTITSDKSGPSLPTAFSLAQNRPNPFNPTTEIAFSLPAATQVQLDILNTVGQRVRTLLDEFRAAGNHSVVWDSRDDNGNSVSSGVYFYRLRAGDYADTRKMVLMK